MYILFGWLLAFRQQKSMLLGYILQEALDAKNKLDFKILTMSYVFTCRILAL